MWIAIITCLFLRSLQVSAMVVNLPSEEETFPRVFPADSQVQAKEPVKMNFENVKVVKLQEADKHKDFVDHRIRSDEMIHDSPDPKDYKHKKLTNGNENDNDVFFDDNKIEKDVEPMSVDDNIDLDREYYVSLLKERDLLEKLQILEKYRYVLMDDPDKANKPIYNRLVAMNLSELRTKILKFLNWRTEDRIKNIFSDNSVPSEDFYREVNYLLTMVKMLDKVDELEGGLLENDKRISNLDMGNIQDNKIEKPKEAEKVNNQIEPIAKLDVPDDTKNDDKIIYSDSAEKLGPIENVNKLEENNKGDSKDSSEFYANEDIIPYWETRIWAMYKNDKIYGIRTSSDLQPVTVQWRTYDNYPIQKRGMSVLTRLKLFASLINPKEGYKSFRKLIPPEQAMYFFKESNTVSAAARTRPIGRPLRWG